MGAVVGVMAIAAVAVAVVIGPLMKDMIQKHLHRSRQRSEEFCNRPRTQEAFRREPEDVRRAGVAIRGQTEVNRELENIPQEARNRAQNILDTLEDVAEDAA